MSDTKHTPEPWSEEDFNRAALFHVNGVTYLQFKNRDTGEVSSRLNIQRIVACVNACAGIPIEALNQLKPGDLSKLFFDHWEAD